MTDLRLRTAGLVTWPLLAYARHAHSRDLGRKVVTEGAPLGVETATHPREPTLAA